MSTVTTTVRGHRIPAAVRRASWLAWAALLLAFAVLEGVNHGAAAWTALAAGLITPDLTFFAAAGAHEPVIRGQLPRKAVPFYNAAHRTWVPLTLAVAYAVAAPLDMPALFTFLLAWMLHIAVDRVAGYKLRGQDGFVRA
jgi:Domain of unknown function (DUF4260)